MENMRFLRKLPIPKEVKEMYPLTQKMKENKKRRDGEIAAILRGEDARLLVVIGPCSADAEDSVLAYVSRLATLAERVKEKLLLIPRVYTGKPRTAADGYKGLLHQPDPAGAPDLFRGLVAMRELHMRVLRETGLSGADEMLYPEEYRYLNDLLSYTAVGARSVENQQHRLTASGLSVPVGMKNPTGGDLSVMMNAIVAARHPHRFIYRGWEVESSGNPLSHAILRGYTDGAGTMMPNYGLSDLLRVGELFASLQLANPAVIVDANHANSGKRCEKQAEVVFDVLKSREQSADVRRILRGLMIESYLLDGNQPVGGGRFGCSITDPCLGWEKSERLLLSLAERV